MGSQLAKSDSQQQQHQQTARTGLLRRAENSQSFSPRASNTSSSDSSAKAVSSIVVVNAGPSAPTALGGTTTDIIRRLPVPLRPLIPIGQTQVNPTYPQLSPTTITDLGLELEAELRRNAELIGREQSKLVEKIRDIDSQVTASSNTIGAERQRRFNKAVDNFGKFDEIDTLIQRCESDIENILTVFVQLNEALPDSLCLEPFALQV